MIAATNVVRAGIWRRGFALAIDFVAAQVALQLVAALLLPVSGGRIQDTNVLSTSCQIEIRQPAGVEIPAGFAPSSRRICVGSFLGFQTARFYAVEHQDVQDAVTTTTSLVFPLDAAGHAVKAVDIAFLQYLVLVVLRWTLDRYAGGSLGRRICGQRIVRSAGCEAHLEPVDPITRRYILFGLAIVPGLAAHLFSIGWSLIVGPVSPATQILAATIAVMPLWIFGIHVERQIAKHQDAFYDAVSGSAVAVVIDGVVEVVDGPVPEPKIVQPLRGLLLDQGRRILAAWPRLTVALLCVLSAVYAAEVLHPAAPTDPNGVAVPTLVLFGGADRELVVQVGQWYRLLFAPFLHGSLVHLLANGLAILVAGWALEDVLGRTWLLTVFVLSGLGGSLASIVWNDPRLVAVGASGALMGLLAAGAVVSGGLPHGSRRRWIEAICLGMLLPTLRAGGHTVIGMIDVADHVGGAVGGAVLGLVVLGLWRRPAPRPPFGVAALGGAAGLAALLLLSIPLAGFGSITTSALLIPPDQVPKTDGEWIARNADLLRRYPSDPRPHLAQAVMEENAANAAARERELETALADARRFNAPSDHSFELKALKVVGAAAQKRHDAATAANLFGRAIAGDPADPEALEGRADAELDQQSYTAALSDFAALQSLRPGDGAVARDIGDAYFAEGDLGAALEAYDRAVSIAPSDKLSLRQRGWARFYAGKGDDALADLEKALALDPKDSYAAIWLDIVAVRIGLPERMAAMVGQLDLNAWPGPVARYYRRQIDEKALDDAASSADPVVRKGQRCEADFYIGEWLIISRADAQARPYLRAALQNCPKDFYEWMAVQAELKGTAGYHVEE